MLKVRVLAAILMAAASLTVNARSVTLTTPSGYKSRAEVSEAKGDVKGVVIMLHGKTANPGTSQYPPFYSKLRKAGYTVIAPKMPWSNFDGTRAQGIEVIDAAVNEAAKSSSKIVIAGHSMGANIALQYLASSPAPQVKGGVPIAFGHAPHQSGKIASITSPSVFKARKLIAEGKGDKKKSYNDVNMGKRGSIRTTSNIYLTFYDPQVFPNIEDELQKIKLPVLWVSGKDDRLTFVLDAPYLFSLLPENPKSEYREEAGDHKGVVSGQAPLVVEWLDKL
jgi:pimeloyl-ACP methyl ester carboxylesterase